MNKEARRRRLSLPDVPLLDVMGAVLPVAVFTLCVLRDFFNGGSKRCLSKLLR